MRRLITWAVLLAVSALLIGAVWADAAALTTMSCCPGPANSSSCHHLCPVSDSNGSVAAPQTSNEVQMVAATDDGLPVVCLTVNVAVRAVEAPVTGAIFKRIHVFLI